VRRRVLQWFERQGWLETDTAQQVRHWHHLDWFGEAVLDDTVKLMAEYPIPPKLEKPLRHGLQTLVSMLGRVSGDARPSGLGH
jgi:hypothetical protein